MHLSFPMRAESKQAHLVVVCVDISACCQQGCYNLHMALPSSMHQCSVTLQRAKLFLVVQSLSYVHLALKGRWLA